MVDLQIFQEDSDTGVSPVIGVILLVAIVVILSAVIGLLATNLGEDLNDAGNASVSSEVSEDSIDLRLTNKSAGTESVDILVDGSVIHSLSSIGESVSLQNLEEGSTISVVAKSGDSTKVVRTISVDQTVGSNPSDGASVVTPSVRTVSGTVDINRSSSDNVLVDGGQVIAVQNGSQVASTTTNSAGEYSFEVPNSDDVQLQVIVEDFSTSEFFSPFYGSGERAISSDTMNLTLESPKTSYVNTDASAPAHLSYSLVGSSDSTQYIATPHQLAGVQEDLGGSYEIVRDIDMSETSSWNGGDGFRLPGTFTGSFDGGNYTLSNLSSNTAGGVFSTNGGQISNLEITGADLSFGGSNGVLAFKNTGTIDNVQVSGSISGSSSGNNIGGLVGESDGGTIRNSSADVDVNPSGSGNAGGLIGYTLGGTTIENSYAIGDITGDSTTMGGLIGTATENTTISESYSVGSVENTDSFGSTGGLVGLTENTTISESYTESDITGNDQLGGFVANLGGSTVTDSYAIGNVNVNDASGSYAGSFVGLVQSGSTSPVTRIYATGEVNTSSTSDDGSGMIGNDFGGGDLTNTYWVGSSSDPDGGTRVSQADLTGTTAETTLSGFDFSNTWVTVSSETPDLQWQSESN